MSEQVEELVKERSRGLHIAIPNYRGWIENPHYQSMIVFAHSLGLMNRAFNWVCPTHTIISTARQIAVNQVLKDEEAQMMLFLDDDMVFMPQDFFALEKQMLENDDIDCIGGLCMANSMPTKPCVFGLVEGCKEYDEENIWWHVMTDYPQNRTFRVYLTGMGFLLISRKMLDAMRRDENGKIIPNYMHFCHTHPLVYNEDLAFCMKARVAGFKIWVDSRVKIGHISKDRPIITEEIYKAHGRAIEYNQGLPRYGPVSEEDTLIVHALEPEKLAGVLADKKAQGRVKELSDV